MKSIGENIKRLREKKNLTQTKLAEMVGYTSRSSISKIEKGEVDLSQSRIMKIAEVLHCSYEDIMEGTVDEMIDSNPIEAMIKVIQKLKNESGISNYQDLPVEVQVQLELTARKAVQRLYDKENL